MELGNVLAIICICSFVFAIVGLVFAAFALIKCLAFERSTHKVMMYNPGSDQEFTEITDEQKEQLLKNEWEDSLIQ